MTTSIQIDILKENIYEKVADIKEEHILQAINTIIDNLETNSLNKATQKRDLTAYIKEWAKNM